MKKFFVVIFLAATLLFNTGFAAMHDRSGTLYQVALLQSLALGHFDGSITVKQLKTFGDTGIGTFDGLDGEMIVLDGVVYRANQNCRVNVVADDVTIPFGNVAFFKATSGGQLVAFNGKDKLDATLNETLRESEMLNNFHMVKICGEFSNLVVRSEAKQFKPYPTLVGALEATQKEFTHKNIRGTIVGLYCPDFMSSLNSPGWHYHFVSDDKKIGGHVLDVNVKDATFQLSKINSFRMALPNNEDFQKLDFKVDLRGDIHKAENETYQGGK